MTATPQAMLNAAPTVRTMIPDQTATVGTAFRYTFPENTFSDSDGDALTYTAAQGDGTALPTWLTFNANSRTFSGTPQAADAGALTVKVTANDGNGGTVSDSFDITVREAAPLGVAAVEGISIHPNPASSHFTLKGISGRVMLISMSGKMVKHYPESKDGLYDVSELSEGILLLVIETKNGRKHTGRVVVRR
ncbi:MAG: putative Ig domain-containing protein [Ekhidna sp.]|nr:putative Ig domain-containing protein [Ekhidna sp.]